jgi:hypothetical protein
MSLLDFMLFTDLGQRYITYNNLVSSYGQEAIYERLNIWNNTCKTILEENGYDSKRADLVQSINNNSRQIKNKKNKKNKKK